MTEAIYIGDEERLARILENPAEDVEVISNDFDVTASVLVAERGIDIKGVIDGILMHESVTSRPVISRSYSS